MDILYTKLEKALKTDPRFVDADGDLFKNEVIDKAYKADHKLIEILISYKELEQKFFSKIKNHSVFNINDFVAYVQDKNFLNDSYTKFKNKIGLNIDGKFLNERKEVALVWPFKDCVLEGGMTKEDQKRKEIFFNEILAHDDIDKLFAPKVLTNWKRYTKNGEEAVKELKRDSDGTIRENLIIKGNNLVALHTLKTQFQGKVKLIYIDPPYYFSDMKQGDSFAYNSNFKLSTWLTFMKNRLEVAKSLLTDDGVIFVQISDDGLGALKALMDDVFDPENFLNIITIQAKTVAGASGGGEDKSLKKNTEYILFYTKDKTNLNYYNNTTEIPLFSLIKEKESVGKKYEYDQILINIEDSSKKVGSIESRGGDIDVFEHKKFVIKSVKQIMREEGLDIYEVYKKYLDRIFRTQDSQSSIRHKVKLLTGNSNESIFSISYTPDTGKNKGIKTQVMYFKGEQINFLSNTTKIVSGEIIKIRPLGSLWSDIGWDGIANEGGVKLKNGKKPEKLLSRILDLSTKEGDVVLDYHLGSGTTCAVAHKMNRQYIGIEQLDYADNDSVARLNNVINGDGTGISKKFQWKGGGDFVYCELMKYNEDFVDQIESAKDTKALLKIWEQMKEKAFFKYSIELKEFDASIEEFKKMDIGKQKEILVSLLNKNQMYVNLSEIEDKGFKVEKGDKELNNKFYK